METLQNVTIFRAADSAPENAKLVRLTPDAAREKIDNLWWDEPNLPVTPRREADRHWYWETIARQYGTDSLHSCVGIVSAQEYWEGAMAYAFDAKSRLKSGAGSVYVGWLASAPRNRPWLVGQPEYKGIGSALLYFAVKESYSAGLGGRVTLESLPTAATLAFYAHKGFIRTDLSQTVTGLVDYELPQAAALAWLRKEGDLP